MEKKIYIDKDRLNYISTVRDGDMIKISLKLKADQRQRFIGTIDVLNRTLIIKRSRYKHLFRKGNAYGFNDYILRNTVMFDKISLSDEHQQWLIPVKEILDNGRLFFKEQGYELQVFISLEDMEPFKV